MNRVLNLLYYSNAFIVNHGGRLHSEAFLREALKNEKINKIFIHPQPSSEVPNIETKSNSHRKRLKGFPLLQIIFFYRRNYRSFKEIVPVIQSLDIDCLHIRLDSNFLIISKLKRLFPQLIITTEVNASPFDENFNNIAFRDYFKKLEQKSLEKATANFFVSGYLRNSIMKKVVVHRDFVVHNGVDLDLFKGNDQKTESEIVTFGYVGTIDYHKNLNILIDAFVKVYQQSAGKVKLLIVGDGPMFLELKEYIKKNKISQAVEFTGWVKHQNIVKFLNKIDIAIHHSANPYMSPLKIFEYMAAGLPVIAPNIPSIKEILTDGQDVLMVNTETEDIAEKMVFLINNKKKRESIASAGQEKIRSNYGWNNNADKILSVIQKKKNEDN